jgi:hypothetical protein
MGHFADMSTLAEIEDAVPLLSGAELAELEQFVRKTREEKRLSSSHSILDLKPVRLGGILRPLGDRSEWHDEMLEGRG